MPASRIHARRSDLRWPMHFCTNVSPTCVSAGQYGAVVKLDCTPILAPGLFQCRLRMSVYGTMPGDLTLESAIVQGDQCVALADHLPGTHVNRLNHP